METHRRQQKSRLLPVFAMLFGIGAICVASYFVLVLRPQKLRGLDIQCSHRVKDIAFVATMWAYENRTNLPTDFSVLRDRFKKPDIFQCPTDGKNYELQRPGFTVRCRFHGHSNTAYQP